MLYVRPDRPVDALTTGVLRELDRVAKELKLAYFVAGAMARDILLGSVFALDTGRATRDVDLAIAVDSWTQFEAIKARLVSIGTFSAAPGSSQRLYYRPTSSTRGYPLDVIPFRGVEQPPQTIAWPPDMKVVMNVVGYEEALTAAVQVQVASDLVVSVASLPGLTVLKLFAWNDRGQADPKDAFDLLTIFRSYSAAGNQDRLYGDAIELLEAVDYDLDLAGPRLLGTDVRQIVTAETTARILSLVGDPARSDRLVTDMARSMRGAEDGVEVSERLLAQFTTGLAGV